MFRKAMGCFTCVFIIMIFSMNSAYPSQADKLIVGPAALSDDALARGILMAGLFGPSTTPPIKPIPEPTRTDQQPAQPQTVTPQAAPPASPSPEATPVPAEPSVPMPSLPVLPAQSAPFVPTEPSTVQPAQQAPTPASPETTQPIAQPVAPAQPGAPEAPQPETVQPTSQPAAPAQPVPAVPHVRPRALAQKRGDVSFNFDDADVYSVIQTIFGDVLKVNYIIDPRVKGRVNFRSVAPVAKEDVLPLMEVILRLNGVGIVEEGGLYRIVPISDLPKEPAPVGMGRDAEQIEVTGKARLQVVPIKYIQSTEMTRILTPFLSATAVIVDVPKSNHVVIIDTDANVKRLLQLVDTFDNEKLKQVTPRVFVYSVQNGKAKDVAALLQQIFQKGGAAPAAAKPATAGTTATTQRAPIPGQPTPAPATPSAPISVGGPATGEGLVSEITRIIPDEITNSVVVLATPEDYALILETMQKIDIMPRQVLIEALVVDITLTDNMNFGLSYSMLTDIKISGLKPFTRDINLTGPASVNSGGLDTTKLSGKGFTFVGYDPTGNVRAVLSALDDQARAKVVAAPHILVTDNREARIQVGQQVPLATSTTAQPIATTTTTTGTAIPVTSTSTIQYKDIGIILKVKPQVNDSGLIGLDLNQEISAISASPVTVGGLDEVAIDKTEATSYLVARDGETIVIGGLIREDVSHATTGFPYLSRLPVIGWLFGTTSDKTTRKETIILLTPHVVRNQQEAGTVTSDYVERYKKRTSDKEIDRFVEEGGRKPGPAQSKPMEPVPNSRN